MFIDVFLVLLVTCLQDNRQLCQHFLQMFYFFNHSIKFSQNKYPNFIFKRRKLKITVQRLYFSFVLDILNKIAAITLYTVDFSFQ